MKFAAGLFGTFLILAATTHAAEDLRGPLAITNVTAVVAPGQTVADATILVRDGRIVSVAADAKLPAGTRVIDGRGGFAYAGFVDGFSRTGIAEPAHDANDERRIEGATDSISDGPHVNMQPANRHGIFARRRATDLLDIDRGTFADHRQAGFTAALLAPPAALFGGSASVVHLGADPLRSSIVAADIAQTGSFTTPDRRNLQERGSYPGTLLGCVAHIRQTLLDAGWYHQATEYAARNPHDLPHDADLERLAHLLQHDGRLAWEASTDDQIRRSLNLLAEFDLTPIIVGGRYAAEAADALAERRAPVLVSLNLPKKPSEYKLDAGRLGREVTDGSILGKDWGKRPYYPQAAYDEATRQRDALLAGPQKLGQAGVRWAFTTHGTDKVADTLDTVRAFIEAGLPVDDAVRALTIAPAEILGCDDQLGTLASGKRGNVTVLSAALDDKHARVTHVVIAGDVFEFHGDADKPDRKNDADRKDDTAKDDDPNATDVEDADEDSDDKQPADDNTDDDKPDDTESTDTPAGPLADVRGHTPAWAIETDAQRGTDFTTGGDILLTGALVLTVSGDDLADTSILVRDGKIAGIGRDLAAGPDVTRVDLSGYVVMPGMIDPHAHTSVAAINEWTMSVTPEVRISDVVVHDDPVMYWAVTGGLTTMHTMHGSANSIGGQNIILKNRYGRPSSELVLEPQHRTIKFALGENVKRQGMNRGRWDQDAPRRFPGTRMGVEATMRRALAAGDAYRRARAAHRNGAAPFRRDLRLEALADVLDGNLWVNCHCYRSDEILRLLAIAEDFDFRIAALHHVLEGYRVMPEIKRHGCGTATFADWWAYKIEAYDAVPHNAGMLLRHGVNSTIKSDSDDLIRHMNVEAAKCMKFSDLTPNEALRMITLNPARLFGIDDRLGSIEVGKDADLAIFDGHPLDTFSRCVMTLIDGEAYFVHRDFDPQNPPAPRAIKQFDDDAPAAQPAGRGGKTPGTVNVRRDNAPVEIDPGQTVFAITHATIHPVSGPVIEDATLVIRDGKIAAVGRDVAIPGEATIVEARGQHVYPGLINAGTNLGLYEIGAVDVTVDTSSPGRHQPDLMAVSALNPHSVMFEVARAEGILTALIVANEPDIAGQAGLVNLAGWTMPEMLLEPRAALLVNLPGGRTDPIVPRERGRRGRGADEDGGRDPLADIDRLFKDARLYEAAGAAGDATFEYDARLAALGPYVRGEKPVLFRAVSYRQILEALQFAALHELRPVIFGGRDAWKLADLLAAREIPVIYEGTFAMPSRVPGLGNVTDVWDGNYRGLATLAEAGVKFAVSRRDADLAKLAATEIGFAVAHGLDPERALRALTLDAAEILGVADTLGSLEVGKLANVIICSDHPAQVTNRVHYAFIAGRHVPTASKHTRMADKFADRPAPDLPPARTDLAGPPSQSR